MDNFVAVTLFRHGVTQANLAKKYVGWSDPPITAEAAALLTDCHGKLPVYDFYITSDLTRCRQTAEIIAPGTPGQSAVNFREMHFGDWELKTYADLQTAPDYRNWLDNPYTVRPPHGECFADFKKRVKQGWKELRNHIGQTASKRVLVVTHGGVIRLLLTKLTGNKRSFWDWDVPHGKGIELSWHLPAWKEDSTCTLLQAVPITEKEIG